MRIGRIQLSGSIRTAALVTAGLALVSMTSGLLLTIHLLTVDHSAEHDSHDCAICQQLLIMSKKIMLVPGIDLIPDGPLYRTNVPAIAGYVSTRYPQASRPRGPPLPTYGV